MNNWENINSREDAKNSVLIIGGGIAGMDCALDLANAGYITYIIEKEQTIGGIYAKIYKIFPFDECSACVLTPKMNSVYRHPLINIITLCDVMEVKGSPGDFQVLINQRPRYVDVIKCTGCQKCIQNCPILVDSEYDFNLCKRHAVYMDFPQQVPLVATIDKEHCINCYMCVQTCTSGAIDHEMEPKNILINAGAVIIATGADEFNPKIKGEYGYGRYENVITSLTFERLTHPTGPVSAKIVRPSDGKRPKKVLMVNCVGARDIQIDKEFCNKVCCMFSLKNARNMKMHEPDAEVYICYIDIRVAGKLFEHYYNTTVNQYGVNLIRGRVAEIQENPETKNLLVRVNDTLKDEVIELDEVELVVLNCSLEIPDNTYELLERLNIEIDPKDKFIKEKDSNLDNILTNIPGIFVIGIAHGPRDGTDSIAEAKAAASASTSLLSQVKYTEEKKEIRSVDDQEPRIGVFVCHCGGVISDTVDSKRVAEAVKDLPNVIYSTDYLFMCSKPGQELIKENIEKHNLNRIVVASCSPVTHESTFRECVEDVGLSRFYFTGPINIREHVAMVHRDDPEIATEKAIEMVKGEIARARFLDRVPLRKIEPVPTVLVVGGGVSGISAALDLAAKDFNVVIIEREDKIGGRLNNLYKTFPNKIPAQDLLDELQGRLQNYNNIKIYTSAEIEELDGYIGNYIVKVILKKENNREIEINAGTILAMIGTKEWDPPKGYYKYNEIDNVLTSIEFEKKLKEESFKKGDSFIFIQCAGSRASKDEIGNQYCSRVCCNFSIVNSIVLREEVPESKVFVLYKEFLRAFGRYMEENYNESKLMGVNYIRWEPSNPPVIEKSENEDIIKVKVYDTLLKEELELNVNYVVLSVGQEAPEGIEKLCKVLGITRSEDGFVEELHLKFKPVETKVPGIYTAATFPKDIADTIALARGAASMSSIKQKGVELEMIVADVNNDECVGCGLCEAVCPYEAITMENLNPYKIVSVTDEIKCQGCGICVASCPVGARDLRWWRDIQILSQIDAILGDYTK
ncbi:MAG: CoB--CoM heterodisulfide reductase iron-sulfur subunit A family protein [Promethearchaeota archaeon]|nr:MAG: CoB--CoM heterodisulfide reductase iron-sulfur subunit A family protein [Candidatus Lokiarchaeota archaeon]